LTDSRSGTAWMAGTSPAMTSNSCIYRESSRTASVLPFPRTAVLCRRGKRWGSLDIDQWRRS
jgi:predicted DNA-binding transcriptional regulator AlpA